MKTFMPTCRDVAAHSSDLLDGSLTWRARLQIRAHLLMCGMCREYVRQMAFMVRALQQLPREMPSESARQRLLDAFRRRRP